MNDAQIARAWAEWALNRGPSDDVPIEGYRAAARHILATTTPPTMADMSPEEREACRWMKVEVYGVPCELGVIIYLTEYHATVMWHDGTTTLRDHKELTPLPDLPRLEWPASEPESTPDHPAVLTIEADYRNAPTGTVVAAEGAEAWAKDLDGLWETWGITSGYTNYAMSDEARQVLRWGWTE